MYTPNTTMTDSSDRQIGDRGRGVPWYNEQLDKLSDGTRELLENYSGIPKDQVLPHVYKVRETAWDVYPYPCIGQFRFLDLSIGNHALYPEILSRMKSGEQNYLDLGCCFGQDIRRLVSDGARAENCYGSDLRLDFMELGYDLFLDKDKLKSRFIEGDVFDPDSNLKELEGQIDIMHTAAFFHLFGLEDQKRIARRAVRLLKPQKGSLLVGRQVGNVQGGEFPHRTNPKQAMYRHDVETWKQMWKDVGNETGTKWDVEAELLDWPGFVGKDGPAWNSEGARRLQFSVRRV